MTFSFDTSLTSFWQTENFDLYGKSVIYIKAYDYVMAATDQKTIDYVLKL